MTNIEKAFLFACKAHKGYKRKGFDQEYIFHPLEVLNLASLITSDEDILCAALLHDTVEDTQTTIDEIRNEFNDRVAQLVSDETEDKRGQKPKKDTWIQRKQETIDKLAEEKDLGIKIVCLCDKVSNLRSFQLLYLHSFSYFLKRIVLLYVNQTNILRYRKEKNYPCQNGKSISILFLRNNLC